jgi:hypothetical protein
VSDTCVQTPASSWNTLIILVVVTLGASTVACDTETLVTAAAVPDGVLNVAVD